MSAIENHLIGLLPQRERQRLVSISEPVHLELAQVLCEFGAPTRHVYFPTQAIISLVVKVADNQSVEVGMVGREGMLGAQLSLGIATVPVLALVQGAGAALRVPAPAFLVLLGNSTALQRLLKRYVHVLMMQLATEAACQRFHKVNARLARWLLMSQDRSMADAFHVTQEFLANMLGVRRVGITNAASALQRNGLIQYHRGEIQVLDRTGLEAAACACYASDKSYYAELLGVSTEA